MNAVELKNVYITNDGTEICKNVSLEIKLKDMIYLTGKTGICKSSI